MIHEFKNFLPLFYRHELKSDQQVSNCLDAKLRSMDYWSGIVPGSFEAHCRRCGMTFLGIQRQVVFRTSTCICMCE